MAIRVLSLEDMVGMIQSCFNGEFAGRNVLVTGHTGFKGGWLCSWLKTLGARVVGYALEPPTQPNLFDLISVKNFVKDYRASILDFSELLRVIQTERPDYVFHLAAQSLVRISYDHPLETLETNILGTANLLEAIRQSDISCTVIVVTSDKCYENKEWSFSYRENDEMGGYDPYSVSKGCAELVCSSWRRSYFAVRRKIRMATVRAGNVLGGGDWAHGRIMADCVTSLLENRPLKIRNPGAVRPWQHVLEPLSGYLWLAACLKSCPDSRLEGPWNFGPFSQNVRSVEELVRAVLAQWGYGTWEKEAEGQPHESQLLSLSCDKAYRGLGWYPVWDFDQTIRETLDWYKTWKAGGVDLHKVCVKQIEEYVECAKRKKLTWVSSKAC